MNKKSIITTIVLLSIIIIAIYKYGRSFWVPIYRKITGKQQTVEKVLKKHGKNIALQLMPHFKKANCHYPPTELTFIAFKQERILEVWSKHNKQWKWIKNYPILGASGYLGPKLQEGDKQVPEGLYYINTLNPNSSYHLSLKINYPNKFDLAMAKIEGRLNPGTNIFIHGKTGSIGCLAMGDAAIEELFVLAALVRPYKIPVIIAPVDFRQGKKYKPKKKLKWVEKLYDRIKKELEKFP